MGNVISNLKARFGVDTTDFKKGLKDGEKSLDDFKGTASSVIEEFASMFGVNMGAVNDAIGTAGKSLNFLGQSFKGAAKGGDVLAVSMKLLKYALVATGLGAIVVVLGTIIAYFTKTGEGTDKFEKILLQVKSVVNNVIDRLAVFGKGLWEIMSGRFKQGWESMTGAFKGMGNEIKEDWKAAGDLADRLDALEDKEIALISSLEERRAKAAELRLQAKEEIEDQKKKLALVDQAAALYKSVYADQLSVEKERLDIMKEQLAIQSSDPTDEQRKEVAEQEAKISSLIREQAEQLKSLNRERKAAAEAVAAELALEKAKAEQVAIMRVELSNLKIPDLATPLSNALAPLKEVGEGIKKVSKDITESLNASFDKAAAEMGEFLGTLMSGNAGIGDFGKMIIGTFADLAINVGKIAIGAGLAVAGVKKALMTLNPVVAIAAGIALVGIGTAVKGALSNAASGSGTSTATASSGFTYDTRGVSGSADQKITLQGEFKIKGADLVYVFNKENNRKMVTT